MPMESSNNPSTSDREAPSSEQQRPSSGQNRHHQRSSQPQHDTADFDQFIGLRILCLHDAHSSASGLKRQLSRLGDRLYLKHGIDLVYINSPLCTSQEAGETDRIWYETISSSSNTSRSTAASPEDNNTTSTNDNKNSQTQEQLLGLDASLCLLQQIWNSMPFWGILGIGQGAAIGSLLSLLPDVKPRAKFGIFIQGEALIQEAEQLVDPNDEDWSCLHIIGT